MNVALIDDDPLIRLYLSKMIPLHFPEINLDSFDTGSDFLEKLEALKAKDGYHKVLLDINLSDFCAWELLDLVDVDTFGQKVKDLFIISSSIHHEDLEKAEDHSLVSSFIKKPILKDTLFSLFG